jgi:hypothetical protein
LLRIGMKIDLIQAAQIRLRVALKPKIRRR